jgi:hypothetical protein
MESTVAVLEKLKSILVKKLADAKSEDEKTRLNAEIAKMEKRIQEGK